MQYADFLQRLKTQYPRTGSLERVSELVIPSLISPVALILPGALFDQAQNIVQVFFDRIRPVESQRLQSRNAAVDSAHRLTEPNHYSVLMSYDFHILQGQLKLIEINTNASMSLLADLMNLERGLSAPVREALVDDFESELGGKLGGRKIAIVDDAPASQKLFIEFLLYKELFENRGAEVAIIDPSELFFQSKPQGGQSGLFTQSGFGPIDLVYNRLTDFNFSDPKSTALRQAMLSSDARPVITPHPFEYECLANKTRLVEWSSPNHLDQYELDAKQLSVLQNCLLQTRSIEGLDPEALWSERKKLIFKPKSAFGGKAVFRGSSISRGVFQDIMSRASEFAVQEFVPAPTVTLAEQHCGDCIPGEFKFDLRFFAYKNEIRIACARLYQGQFTNATTPGGGVTSIQWDYSLNPDDPVVARTRS